MLELFKDEEFFATVDLLNVCIYWKDKDGRYLGCNKHFLNTVGAIRRDVVIGKTDFDMWEAKNAAIFQVNDKIALKKGIFVGEETVDLDRGKRVTYQSTKTQLRDFTGKVIGISACSVVIAINETRLQEINQQTLLNEKIKLFQIIDLIDAAIYWKDSEGRYLGCNNYVVAMFDLNERYDVIGKTDYDLLPNETASKLAEIDQLVMDNGDYSGEECLQTLEGKPLYFISVKNQLLDNRGDVIGIIGASIDISAQKEADQLAKEHECQKVATEENVRFKKVVDKLAHDIASPLTALCIMVPILPNIPDGQRSTLKQIAERLKDIVHDLKKQFLKKAPKNTPEIVIPNTLFTSIELLAILSEKRTEYAHKTVHFVDNIDKDAYFAFIKVNRKSWQHMLSNLVNNAVEQIGNSAGAIQVGLKQSGDKLLMEISDNGKPMHTKIRQLILDGIADSDDGEHGQGPGMSQVIDAIRNNHGELKIEYNEGAPGTRVTVSFRLVEMPDWVATQLVIRPDQTVLVLDDDTFIHDAWDARFATILTNYPQMELIHFTEGCELLDFCSHIAQEDRSNYCLLSDYDLINQEWNGLDIIEKLKLETATLVTSYYADVEVVERAKSLNVHILPKPLASEVPIFIIPGG